MFGRGGEDKRCVFALDWLKGRLSFLLAMEMKKVVTKTVF